MNTFRRKVTALISAALMLFSVTASLPASAADVEENPSAGAMMADLLVARPLLLAGTVLGTAVYVVALPFTLLGGNAGDAAETLVLDPAEATFLRCLGCSSSDQPEDE